MNSEEPEKLVYSAYANNGNIQPVNVADAVGSTCIRKFAASDVWQCC